MVNLQLLILIRYSQMFSSPSFSLSIIFHALLLAFPCPPSTKQSQWKQRLYFSSPPPCLLLFAVLCGKEIGRSGVESSAFVSQSEIFCLRGKKHCSARSFARPRNILGNNVSSFAGAFRIGPRNL